MNRVLFHQDIAPAHKSVVAILGFVRDSGFELVDHPPYSDLTPSDYFLFPQHEKKHTWLEAIAVSDR